MLVVVVNEHLDSGVFEQFRQDAYPAGRLGVHDDELFDGREVYVLKPLKGQGMKRFNELAELLFLCARKDKFGVRV
jgi:hypothetical protein